MIFFNLARAIEMEATFQEWLAPGNRKQRDLWPYLRDLFIREQVGVAQNMLGNKWYAR